MTNKIKKMISIDEKMWEDGKEDAKKLGLSFSSYVSFLIVNERKNQQRLDNFSKSRTLDLDFEE